MTKANCNWWQYSRWTYNVGRTSRYMPYSDDEKTAVITFITSIMESRPALVPRIRLKYLNPVDDLTKQNDLSLGMMLQLIGRNLKVDAPTDAEKTACDTLFTATGDRKIKVVKIEEAEEAKEERTITVAVNDEEMGTAEITSPDKDKFYDGDELVLTATPKT